MWHALLQHGSAIRWASFGLMAMSLILVARLAPWRVALAAVGGWIDSLGPWAPVAFVGLYLAATLLLLPGWWLSVLAGAMFGMAWGLVLSWMASSLAILLAFLLARYVARGRIIRAEQSHPTVRAIDAAVREGGWRIVALTRMSPLTPFGLMNYVYGLTAIRFRTCVVASCIFILPGTIVHVYVGSLARAGAQAATSPVESSVNLWLLRIAGLLATAAAVYYITRLARAKLREQMADAAPRPPHPENADMNPTASITKTLTLATAATLMLTGSVYAQFHASEVRSVMAEMIGAQSFTAVEAFERKPGGPTVDHSRFTAVLGRIVTDDLMVDYEKLREDPRELRAYLDTLAAADFDGLDRDEKLALLINAYNAFTLQLILDHWPVASIKDIPEDQRWDAKRWKVGGHTLSLTEIEHGWLRAKFIEPRIHFAINCASVGCPPLLEEAYVADRLEDQLQRVTRAVHDSPSRWFQYDGEAGVVRLTKLYDWYGEDFEQVADSPLDFAARYVPALKQAMDAGQRPRIEWIPYDWSLNIRGATAD